MMNSVLSKTSKNSVEELLHRGKDVIAIEADGLMALHHRIGEEFAQACHLLLQCQGRVIVLGVGKSGHIGRKIAATLASMGTPSFFIHPAEMSHGDLGMLTGADVLLAISNSGETVEIVDLLPYFHRLKLPLIAFTRPHSTLAKTATVCLDIQVGKEAGALGLAPTTSTTVSLALGDALAITVSEAKGFSKQDFSLFHPGGTLGKHLLLKIENIMHTGEKIPVVVEDTLLDEVIVEVTQKRLGMTVVVTREGKLMGIYTDGDIRRNVQQKKDFHKTKIQDVMTMQCKTISPAQDAAQALELMERHKITSLVVMKEDQVPLGILHLHDLLQLGFYSR